VVWCGVVVVVVFLTDNNTTPTKVVLNCFGLLVGLWQLTLVTIQYSSMLIISEIKVELFIWSALLW
jgi:hypothetical protein